jgi:hypothetical protein
MGGPEQVLKLLPTYLSKGIQMEVQTRNKDGEILIFSTVSMAFLHASKDKTVWKISWEDANGDRKRFVRSNKYGTWESEPFNFFYGRI